MSVARFILVLLVGGTNVLGLASGALASDGGASAGTGGNYFYVDATSEVDEGVSTTTPAGGGGLSSQLVTETVCEIGGLSTCDAPKLCEDGSVMTASWLLFEDGSQSASSYSCPQEEVVEELPVVTPGLVLSAFRRVGLPASELVVQPPGGRTLVNFETSS